MNHISRLLALTLALGFASSFAGPGGPLPIGTNALYTSNRPPLVPAPLIKLPVGSVRPEGWLRRQLELMSDGFSGRLTEISKWCKIAGNAWTSPDGQGQSGWEEVPYWLRGYIDLAYLLQDARMIAEARQWIDGVLANQDSTGYFGPRRNKVQPDIWPNMVMLYALRTFYEATDDPRVIPFMQRYARWLGTVPLDRYLPDSWQKWRGGDNLDHIYWLYNRTGDLWLLELARTNHERTADWTGGIPTWHGVNLTQGFREPAEYYQQSGDPRYLQAAARNYDSVMHSYGEVPGGMFGADENARPGYAGPRQAAESCSMVEFMFSDEMLTGITGETVWADRCEEIAFNSLPAAFTPDLKGLHYLTAPNMVQLDTTGKGTMFDNDGDMLSYNPHRYRCCQHNTAFGWPYFTEHLFMATADNGLAAVLYAPSSVTAKVGDGTPVTVTESTHYPFGETVELKLTSSRPVAFPLTLRMPGWCSTPRVTVNGEKIKEIATSGSWLVLARRWKNGDVVRLEFPQAPAVKTWANHAVSVRRGPLWYSLKIGERWQRNGGTEAWPAFEVFPTTPWNYGLVIDPKDPARSLQLAHKPGPLDPQPFTPAAAPLALSLKAKRIPAWKQEPNGLVGQVPAAPYVAEGPAETVTLIPMGCARLRVSVFPLLIDN
ncbi:MAG TPA: beta-L-arabinofuranosidase domain-containing protein [Bacteroidota bacterium]